MNTKFLIALFSLICLFSLSSSALACACCAERGEHSTSTRGIDSFYLAMLDDINLDPVAELYETPAGFDAIRGLGSIETEYNSGLWTDFSLVDAFTKNAWNLTFKTPGGKSGTLVLPKPPRVTIFRVDQRNDAAPEGAMVVLYKEFRITGTVRSGSGIFRSGLTRPATYSLIFQGKGNNCDDASDFSHWRLDVSGSKARYALFGKVAKIGEGS